jgi:homogentisate 1,2-dioxygenase
VNISTTKKKTYEWSKWKDSAQKTPRAIDWVARQWPGTTAGFPPNPWEYELVLFNGDMNGKKENVRLPATNSPRSLSVQVWSAKDKNIFVQPQVDANDKMKKTKKNSKTLEAFYANVKYDSGKVVKWDKNKGTCKAIYTFNTIMGIAQYHNDPYIQEVLRAQVIRVGKA